LIKALGPGRTSLALQLNANLATANQSYHRESMKGQTADVPNLHPLFVLPPPPLLALTPDETGGEVVHRDSMKGQVADVPNHLVLGLTNAYPSTGQMRPLVINPVFYKHPVQDTTIQRSIALDILSVTLPFPSPVFEVEETYRHDSLGGQYARSGAVVVIGVPPAFNEIYTPIPRLKTAQEPFILPNALILGIAASAEPFVERQSEDLQWRAHATQEPFVLPNVLAFTKAVTRPFVKSLTEDHKWRAKPAQETYDFPNAVIRNLPPNIVLPFVDQQYESLQWRAHKTQEHYDFPNVIFYNLPPLPPPILGVVPYVLGIPYAQAEAILEQYSFYNLQVDFAYDTVNPPGIVFVQAPLAGTVWPSANVVTIIVSEGPFVPNAPQLPVLKVSTRAFSLEEMVSREWGANFRAPDHRIYNFPGRSFDSTDIANTGIYRRNIENAAIPLPPGTIALANGSYLLPNGQIIVPGAPPPGGN